MRATRLRLAAPSLALARTRLATSVLPRLDTRPLSTGDAPHARVRALDAATDPYQVLGGRLGGDQGGLPQTGMKYHGSNAGDPAAEQKFQDVSAAYAQLTAAAVAAEAAARRAALAAARAWWRLRRPAASATGRRAVSEMMADTAAGGGGFAGTQQQR